MAVFVSRTRRKGRGAPSLAQFGRAMHIIKGGVNYHF
jgi:hypothetical protein